jgi:hypothetical protein
MRYIHIRYSTFEFAPYKKLALMRSAVPSQRIQTIWHANISPKGPDKCHSRPRQRRPERQGLHRYQSTMPGGETLHGVDGTPSCHPAPGPDVHENASYLRNIFNLCATQTSLILP